MMVHFRAVSAACVLAAGCASHEPVDRGSDLLGAAQAMKIELLGFPDCPNTPTMRENLRTALKSLGRGLAFEDVNQEALAADDMRRGWAAPTVLVNGVDLLGAAAPTAAAMACRAYPDGVPDADTIASRLRSLASAEASLDTRR